MFKKITTGALTLLSCVNSAETTLNVTPEQGAQLACYIVAEDFVVFDLSDLEKPHDDCYDYYDAATQGGLEWNFCKYLDHTTCFAKDNGLDHPSRCLTSEDYLPASYKMVQADDSKHVTGI